MLKNFFVVYTVGHHPNLLISRVVNMASIFVCSSMTEIGNLLCACKKLVADSWILDFDTSYHMTYKKDLLTNIVILPYPFLISLPNGYKVKAIEVGDLYLSFALTLCMVLFVPIFKFNLISIHCLTSSFQSIVSFINYFYVMQDP